MDTPPKETLSLVAFILMVIGWIEMRIKQKVGSNQKVQDVRNENFAKGIEALQEIQTGLLGDIRELIGEFRASRENRLEWRTGDHK